ncbi:MAG: TAXI family TRAP transporter solute-binding subunit, partial [bacterium]
MKLANKFGLPKIITTCTETFGLSRAVAITAMVVIALFTVVVVFWFIRSAPPKTIIITSGPAGSVFHSNAVKYAGILARNGVRLEILTSQGSLENLKRLGNPSCRVDIGFVQGGVTNGANTSKLVSLGSFFYEPVLVFYRGTTTIELLSELAGKRLSIGSAGSGTHALALNLLAANGIEPDGATELLDLDGEAAAAALMDGKVDAVFLMGDSASTQVMRKLVRTSGVQMLDFTQADGYTRRIDYLHKLEIPKGCLDFGKNLPAHAFQLIGPTVDLIARPDLHPALAYLLLDAAR